MELQVHLVLEKDYLYPEIAGLFGGSEALVAGSLANATMIGKRLKSLMKMVSKTVAEQESYPKRLSELHESVLSHLEQAEQALMPKMRLMIRTEDREDLGQVFIDVKAELSWRRCSGRRFLARPAAATGPEPLSAA